ncbi:D-2-hydroxyacid dehydrogenase [Eubacteriales bacterium OttesenSCG-928-M02]|nr:D-2-hydroxyacid dehydrogenase [Eubacteriales bacterium OttesenSCG-928-M02]
MQKKTCVILDADTVNPGDLSWDSLEKLVDLSVHTIYPSTPVEEVLSCIGDAELVLLNKIPITADFITHTPSLKYIGVLATGFNVVDTAACKQAGITVTNIPAYSTMAVGQMAMALLLEIALHVGEHSRSVLGGDWANSKSFTYWNYPLFELAGKTFGVYGFGRTGQATAQMAAAFGLDVVVADSHVAGKDVPYPVLSMEQFYQQADIISYHCPLTPETTGLVNKEAIGQMKDGVILLNTSRGGVVNEGDLAQALNSGKVRAAGVDVLSTEPPKEDNPLLSAKNIIITPHIAWAPVQCRQRLIQIAGDNLAAYLSGAPINVVNP